MSNGKSSGPSNGCHFMAGERHQPEKPPSTNGGGHGKRRKLTPPPESKRPRLSDNFSQQRCDSPEVRDKDHGKELADRRVSGESPRRYPDSALSLPRVHSPRRDRLPSRSADALKNTIADEYISDGCSDLDLELMADEGFYQSMDAGMRDSLKIIGYLLTIRHEYADVQKKLKIADEENKRLLRETESRIASKGNSATGGLRKELSECRAKLITVEADLKVSRLAAANHLAAYEELKKEMGAMEESFNKQLADQKDSEYWNAMETFRYHTLKENPGLHIRFDFMSSPDDVGAAGAPGPSNDKNIPLEGERKLDVLDNLDVEETYSCEGV